MMRFAGLVSCDELAGGIAAGFSGMNVAQANGTENAGGRACLVDRGASIQRRTVKASIATIGRPGIPATLMVNVWVPGFVQVRVKSASGRPRNRGA